MTKRQSKDGRITLAELLETLLAIIREYEGATGIFRKDSKEQE